MQVPVTGSVGQRLSSWLGRDWLGGLILVLAVVLVYQPVWHAGFIWDDDRIITANPCIIGPLGLKEIWTTSAADICPLTITTFWGEHALWGLAPLPYHLVNVLLHGGCAIVLWLVLRSLRIPGAWLGAALWALHPVEVESVAWITEMKNTESGLFFLLSILFFLRWLGARDSVAGSRRTPCDGPAQGTAPATHDTWTKFYYALTLVFAALAMASKSSTVILPIVLCLCAWWLEGRWHWRNLMKAGPIFLMSIAAGALSLWTQGLRLATADPQWARTWPERLVTAGDAVWFYLGKLVWPQPLMMVYPRWKIDAGQWVSYVPLLAVIIVLFVLWLNRETWSRPWFFAFAYFLAALLPVLGLADNTIFPYSLVFDHFQYLAGMGPLALAGAGFVRLSDFVLPGKRRLQSGLCTGLLVIVGIVSWQRTRVFESEETLWTDTLAKNPNCWVGYNNLGTVLFNQGRGDEALADYQKALEINPNYDLAHNNLGTVFVEKGQLDQAMAEYQKALELNPNYADAHNNLGLALFKTGQVNEAMARYQKALEIDPYYAEAHNNLGNVLAQKGQVDEAMAEYQKALELNPNFADAHNDLGLALVSKGRLDEGMAEYQKALEINPSYADAHYNLGLVVSQRGQVDEAIVEYQKALEINPNFAKAHNNLGLAFFNKGQLDKAMAEYQKALEIDPNKANTRNNLGLVLSQKGQLDEAIEQYQKALEIDPSLAETHSNLGSALVQKGRLDEAMAQFQKALQIKPDYTDAQNNLAKVKAMVRQKAARP